ncbi:MAG: hypothetical protein LBT46_11645 [Planctomycetaceae bacterium]|jgi:hypothetical protein|nr:hypothetical protein [Planctomycetaceae bacterium]
MTSPSTTSALPGEPKTLRHRVITPARKIITSAIILLTGSGIAAVFWKMPEHNAGLYDICDQSVVDPQLAAVPLPKDSLSHATISEIEQMSLPVLEGNSSADTGSGKYAQAYPVPEGIAAARNAATSVGDAGRKDGEAKFVPIAAQKIEPVRRMIPAVPMTAETVNKTFHEKPKNSFDTSAVNDEMTVLFQFAENLNAENESKAKDSPENPFSAAVNHLKPLEPLPKSRMLPLQPL